MEHGEHAEHAAHSGNTRAALLVAVLAAVLAICEQQAKHAETRLEESSIGATDAWAQYQAKSIRVTIARDLADVVAAGNAGAATNAPASTASIALEKRLRDDAAHYEHGADGKDAIAARAKALGEERDYAVRQTHAFDNAAALLELGIVLSTASAITAAKPLLITAALVGLVGLVLGILGYVAPALGAL
jgi:hypothetical protein